MTPLSDVLQFLHFSDGVSGLERAQAHLPGWAGRLALRASAALLVAAIGGRYAAGATVANRGDAAVIALVQLPAMEIAKCKSQTADEHGATRVNDRFAHNHPSSRSSLGSGQCRTHLRSTSRAAGDAVALSCVADAGMRSSPPSVGTAPIASSLQVTRLVSETEDSKDEQHPSCRVYIHINIYHNIRNGERFTIRGVGRAWTHRLADLTVPLSPLCLIACGAPQAWPPTRCAQASLAKAFDKAQPV